MYYVICDMQYAVYTISSIIFYAGKARGQENDINVHQPVPVLRAILPLPFPMHKQCRQIMDRFLVVDRSFVIPPKKKREKKGALQ